MEQPIFYQGQRVVCIRKFPPCGHTIENPLIEGKSYYVEDPNFKHSLSNKVCVIVVGIYAAFRQTQFIPYDTDKELQDEIHEALKGEKIILKYSSSN